MRPVERTHRTYQKIAVRFDEPCQYAGYRLYDPLGKNVGIVEDLFVNGEGEPEYVKAKIGFFGLRSLLIPVQTVAVDEEREVLVLQ